MEKEIGLFDAKNKLSALVNSVREEGKEYIILRRGKPAARLVPITQASPVRYALSGEVYDPVKARAAVESMKIQRQQMKQSGGGMSQDEIVKMIRDMRDGRAEQILTSAGMIKDTDVTGS